MAELRQEKFNVFCVEQEVEWLFETIPAIVSSPRCVIEADGIDSTSVEAVVPEGVTEITFYKLDTGEEIVTLPVDENTGKATLEITSTEVGLIGIRAGEETKSKLNCITISAVEAITVL